MLAWLRRLWSRVNGHEEVVREIEETLVVAELPDGETLVMDIEEIVTAEVQKPRRVWLWAVLGALLALGLLLWLLLSMWCHQPVPVVDNPPPPVVTAPPTVEPPVVAPPVALPPPPPVVKPVVKPVSVVHHKAKAHRHHCH